MSTKNQHFVPQVYLKAWETTVFSIKEPTKPFQGVYHFEKNNLIVGNGRNKENLLSNNHTYTIDFQGFFLMKKHSFVRKEFLEKLKNILTDRKVDVYIDSKKVKRNHDLLSNIDTLDNWEFVNYDGSLARKRAIINSIKDIRCYCIENKFDDYMEKRWESILNNFLSHCPKVDGTGQLELFYNDLTVVSDMLTMVALMMCRNPKFELFGLFDIIFGKILPNVFETWGDDEAKHKAIRELKHSAWLSQIYRGLFEDEQSFARVFTSIGMEKFGLMVFRVRSLDEGSFITSDNPVIQYTQIPAQANTMGIYFPVSPEFLIFIGKNTDGEIKEAVFRTVNNDDIRKINRIILNGATKDIVSSSKHLGYIL